MNKLMACVTVAVAMGAAFPAQAGPVEFIYDGTRMSGLKVHSQPTLGPEVGTGGIYLIGSKDGSDAHGKSVQSIGGSGGYMHSDDPAKVPPPKYKLTFTPVDGQRVKFYAEVGPATTDFNAMGLAIDFGKNVFQSFEFAGTKYWWQCTGRDGPRTGSGATFASIPQGCAITDASGHLIGMVGVAKTNAPTSWGEVTGPLGTVRVTVTGYSKYKSMDFTNHFGTDNIGLDFGGMKKGTTVFIQGEIQVLPGAVPSSWTYQAESALAHQIGRVDGDGWSVRVGDPTQSYMAYGPYTTSIIAGSRTASFRLMLDNVTADNAKILTLDVFDAANGRVLAKRDIKRQQFSKSFTYQDFDLPFTAAPGQKLEFRTFWWNYSYAKLDKVVVH